VFKATAARLKPIDVFEAPRNQGVSGPPQASTCGGLPRDTTK